MVHNMKMLSQPPRWYPSFHPFRRGLWGRISSVFYRSVSLLPLLFAIPAFAQTTPVITNAAGAQKQICNVFNDMFGVLIFVSIMMVLWAAYLYLTARDDAEQITQAKKAIFYAAIGLVVAFIARGFPVLIAGIFPGGAQGVTGC